MTDDTGPVAVPVRMDRGRWRCLICDKSGPGGSDGFAAHYGDWHWDYWKDG